MYSLTFSILFVIFLVLTLSVRLWLSSRHIRHILTYRPAVPSQFSEKIALSAHQKAADYTIAKTKLSVLSMLFGATLLLGFTLLGGLQWLSVNVLSITGPGMNYEIALLVAFATISGLLDLPFDYYKQFVLEEKFGFNKMTFGLFIADMLKGIALSALIGLPLIWVILTLMGKAGDLWWFYAWCVWSGFQLLMLVLYPTLIAPMSNNVL